MEGMLVKVSSAKDDTARLTIDVPRKNLTVDILEFVNKPIEVKIPDEQ